MKKWSLLLLTSLLLVGCGSSEESGDECGPIVSIAAQGDVKANYVVGDYVDLTNLAVVGTYEKCNKTTYIDNYDYSPKTPLTLDDNKITITYSNLSTYIPITVTSPSVTCVDVYISSNPTKTSYEVGETVDLTGLVITGRYSDGSTKTLSNSLFTVSPSGTLKESDKQVTLTADIDGTKSVSYSITVTAKQELLTIAEVVELCNKLTPATDDWKITKSETTVKFIGQAIDGINTVASSSKCTPEMKVLVADATGYILCASAPGSQSQNTLYRSFVNNKTKRNSKYTLEGTIGLYRNQPEVVITSFTWDENLDINYDLDDFSRGKLDNIPAFYDAAVNEADYNCKGAGIGFIHSIENVKCLGKADDNSWIFSDASKQVFGVYDFISNTSFQAGSQYDILGTVTTNQWKPSLRVLEYSLNTTGEEVPNPLDAASEITIKNTYSIKRPKLGDNDFRRYPNYLRSSATIYTSEVYFDAYQPSGSSRPTYICGDQYYQTQTTTKEIAASRYMIGFNNADYNFSNLDDKVGQNQSYRIYFYLYQQDQITYGGTTYMPWKVYLFPTL